MPKKKRFFISAVSLMLTMAFAVVGVYSAINTKNWNVNGKITLEVNSIEGKMVVYEGKVVGGKFVYYDTDILDKDFEDVNAPWLLSEEHTTLTRAKDNYFYQIIIQNTNESAMYVSFEVPTSIVKNLVNDGDNLVNGTWLYQGLLLTIFNQYDKVLLTSEDMITSTNEDVDKLYSHHTGSDFQFPATKATEYDESGLNNIGDENDYTTFSIKLEAGQVFSLYSLYKADFDLYSSEASSEFTVSNNLGVNYFKPTL